MSKEEQTSLAKHRHPDKLHSASAPQYIRAISMCHPDIIIRIINQSKASLTRYHDSQLWPTSHHLQNEKTRGSDSKSLPMIILHNHFPRSLTAASPTMVSDSRSQGDNAPTDTYCHHHNIKYLLTINERNSTPEAVYICLRTKKKGILLVTF